jgi:hypothetical protein
MVDRVALGRFSSRISVAPTNHSTDCSTLIITLHPGLVQEAKQWPMYQVDSSSPYLKKLKLKKVMKNEPGIGTTQFQKQLRVLEETPLLTLRMDETLPHVVFITSVEKGN